MRKLLSAYRLLIATVLTVVSAVPAGTPVLEALGKPFGAGPGAPAGTGLGVGAGLLAPP